MIDALYKHEMVARVKKFQALGGHQRWVEFAERTAVDCGLWSGTRDPKAFHDDALKMFLAELCWDDIYDPPSDRWQL